MDARDYMLQALEALQNGNRTWDAMDILIKGLDAVPAVQLPTDRPDTDSQQ